MAKTKHKYFTDAEMAVAGKVECGCWYHAEDGIPCVHDLESIYPADKARMISAGHRLDQPDMTPDEIEAMCAEQAEFMALCAGDDAVKN